MNRLQTLILLAAVVVASLSAINLGGRPRPLLALLAVVLMALAIYLRMRAKMSARRTPGAFDAYDRAQRIHEARAKKYWH